ncbi:hypothetical protein BDZ91DRAFT_728592 [Kalaharituber pfeilii]|nr:hypothetical protein BDZ91DRAFT_728592 [Kalaharituber pfeilii]
MPATALAIAVEYNCLRAVKWLLRRGADLNVRGPDGNALVNLPGVICAQTMRLLVWAGAGPDTVDPEDVSYERVEWPNP